MPKPCETSVSDSLANIHDDLEFVTEAAAAEIRTALRLTRRAADSELAFALDLEQRLPAVWEALVAGNIDVRRAKTIAYGTAHLPPDTAGLVVDDVIEEAHRSTTGQLAARIRCLCIDIDPDEAERRSTDAVSERRIVSDPTTSGTVNLSGLELPPDRVAAATRRINHLARGLRGGGETRTIDQLRADVFLDLLEGTKRDAGRGGSVDIRVDLDTLAGLTESAGDLAGYGPVIADIARRVAEQQPRSTWRYTVTDPATGRAIAAGTTRRRPTAAQRRHVEAVNSTCVFPGCRMPASDCDLDHRIPVSDGGPTARWNLVPLCRHDHRIRHLARWTHQPLPGGDHQWTSRLGRTYTTSGRSP